TSYWSHSTKTGLRCATWPDHSLRKVTQAPSNIHIATSHRSERDGRRSARFDLDRPSISGQRTIHHRTAYTIGRPEDRSAPSSGDKRNCSQREARSAQKHKTLLTGSQSVSANR